MNDNFDNQKEILLSLRQEINLLRQQVDYLLRNEKALGLLDLDVLMNRTHTVYDMLCSINLGGNDEEQDFDIDPDAISGLFGSLMQQEQQEESQEEVPETEKDEEKPENEPLEEIEEEEIPEEKQSNEEINAQEKPSDTVEFVIETPAEEETEAPENFNPMDEPVEDKPVEEKKEEQPLGDEYGFFFRFDDVAEEQTQQPEEQPIQEEKIVHFVEEIPEEEIPERDLVDGDHLVHDNPFVMPVVEDGENAENHFDEEPVLIPRNDEPVYEPVAELEEQTAFEPEEQTFEETESEPIEEFEEEFEEELEEPEKQEEPEEFDEPMPFVNDFEKDDAEYELDTPETLVEHLQHDDNTLAAKLQQKPINELRTAIGINDKFLFVNELFGGSMEKYNRSIENLDDMKTLNGTLIYLNELKVELQWNSSNEAYQKLLNLIHRKFGD